MATARQTKAARQNVGKAQEAAASKRTIGHMPKRTRTALGQQQAGREEGGPQEESGQTAGR